MGVTATITRNRRSRATSSWDFAVTAHVVTVKGSVTCDNEMGDIAFERAGWDAVDIVAAITETVTDGQPVPITYVGLPPHPAGQKAEPEQPPLRGAINVSNDSQK